MFPLDYQNKIEIIRSDESDITDYQKRFLTKISEELRIVKATDIQIQGNRVSFWVAFFRLVSNWNILVSIDSGYLEVTPSANKIIISYYISFKRLLIVVTLVVIFLGIIIFLDTPSSVITNILILVAAWLWVAGANCLVTMIRYSAFIKRIISEVAQ